MLRTVSQSSWGCPGSAHLLGLCGSRVHHVDTQERFGHSQGHIPSEEDTGPRTKRQAPPGSGFLTAPFTCPIQIYCLKLSSAFLRIPDSMKHMHAGTDVTQDWPLPWESNVEELPHLFLLEKSRKGYLEETKLHHQVEEAEELGELKGPAGC